jgi:hypothetical protein
MSTYEGTKEKTETAGGGIINWPPYHWIDQPVQPILDNFWQMTYDQSDLDNHQRFIKMLSLRKQGMCD